MDAWVQSGGPHQIVTVNLDFMRLARSDAEFRCIVNQADLAVPDGVPVLWAAKLLGDPLVERVTGVEIVEKGAVLAARRGYRLFLLGAAPGVAERAGAELVRRNPGLCVAGTYSPPFGPSTPQEEERIADRIAAARPDLLFVAFGAPRQDVWIYQHGLALGVPVCVGVGGTFDILAGDVVRAPVWMQRRGLEWLHRLRQEPLRLWRRYLLGDLPLFVRVLATKLSPFARAG
jgi:N-acetylglucosaminyldiphosphoundecaprenol N-acetyl-beta-D-mannosaminyltransferase